MKKKGPKKDPQKSVEEERRLQLLTLAKSLKKKVKTETNDFNRFQTQRDQLNYFWVFERKNLEDKKSERRHKDREEQDLEEKHQVDIKLYKQSVKHLLHEHQEEVTDLKTHYEMLSKLQEDGAREESAKKKQDEREAKVELKLTETSHQDFITKIKHEHDENIKRVRSEYELRSKELRIKFEQKMNWIRVKMETQRKTETQQIEENKNAHIDSLVKEHGEAFAKIKAYYHDITHTNLDKIKGLKEDVALLKSKAQNDKKKMEKITRENKKMKKPLQIAQAEVEQLKKQLGEYVLSLFISTHTKLTHLQINRYNKDKSILKTFKEKLLSKEEEMENLKWKIEVLGQQFESVQKEKDALYDQFQESIYDVKQKSNFKRQLLERKIDAMNSKLEQTDVHMNKFLSHANVEEISSRPTTDVMEHKNEEIRELQMKLQTLVDKHNDLISHYEARMVEHGVPIEELGFMPKVLKPSDFK